MVEIGKTHQVVFPFYRGKATISDEEGYCTINTWCPGLRSEIQEQVCGVNYYADGHGLMLITVVSIHKPGRFPTRVFYTRQWQDPEGKRFGKGRLFIATQQKFNRLIRGYGYNDYHYENGGAV